MSLSYATLTTTESQPVTQPDGLLIITPSPVNYETTMWLKEYNEANGTNFIWKEL